MPKVTDYKTLSESDWVESLRDWLIVGCSVRRGPVISLAIRKDIPNEELTRMWDEEVPTRVFGFSLTTGASGFFHFHSGMPFPCVGTSELPDSLTLCAARSPTGPVWAYNPTYAAIEEVQPEAQGQHSESLSVKRVARVAGRAYFVSMFRRLFRRDGPNQWTEVSQGIPRLTQKELAGKRNFGFSDLHGLSEDNMYAVGGHGDVWRYDGSRWLQCDFPSNKQLDTVTVAPDGQVYISGQSGSLWVGREDRWTLISNGSSSVPYNDSRWFKGKLWLISDYQLHVLEEGELRRTSYNGSRIVYTGWMDCTDDLLVIATNSGSVHVFDGTDWKTVIRPYS